MAHYEHFGLSEDEQKEIAALHRTGESALVIAQHLGIPAASVADYVEYYDLRQFKKVVNRISGAAFVLGVGLLLLPVVPLPFWPGILFVLGITALIRAFARYHRAGNIQAAAWMFGLGLMFNRGIDFSITAIFVLIGFSIIVGILFRGRYDDIDEDEKDEGEDKDEDDEQERRREVRRAKRKNEELLRDDEKPKRDDNPTRLRLSDDGELSEEVDLDQEAHSASRR